MNTETTLKMWHDHLTPTFRARREELGVQDRGGIIFDAFTGNEGDGCGQDVRRQVWSESMNVCILPKIPGKGSVKQQPCDRVHANWRRFTDCAEDVCLGMHDDPFKRSFLEDVLMADWCAAKKTQLCFETVVDVNLWAWECMPPALGRRAWIATGYVTVAQMASFWHVRGS